MNVTELARRLKIPTKELRELLPKLGFDIGKKAIKIDNKLANEIIQNWGRLMYEYKKRLEYEQRKKHLEQIQEKNKKEQKVVYIPPILTVREFANLLSLPVNVVITELMKNGIIVSLNERLDFDTAAIIGEELGFNVLEKQDQDFEFEQSEEKLKKVLEEQKKSGKQRPPVIVIMGHVDHGKTKLLDKIRSSNVVEKEAGGITQHIGAYQVNYKGKVITFIDTPGHEAFTAMRSRGAKVADIAILIVAADDSVKPQTIEALKIIQKSNLPMIVAINKIDKPEANIEKVKTDLSKLNLIPEDWGGQTIMVPISALTGQGIDELLEMILLVADLHKQDLVADPNRNAVGTIIESHVDKGEGIVATVLVHAGTLKLGDLISINGNYYGKVRSMKDFLGNDVQEAVPSMPVKIIGLKIQPKVGDLLEVPEDEKSINKKVKKYELEKFVDRSILTNIKQEKDEANKKFLNVIIKADVLGSLEAIIESLEKIENELVGVKIISKGLGHITENDIELAKTTNSLLIAFHINNPPQIEILAREKGVKILKYDIIYKLLEDIKDKMEELLGEEVIRKDFGKLEVLKIFKHDKKEMILGGKVIEGKIEFKPDKFETKIIVTRDGTYITEGVLKDLQESKQKVSEVMQGHECGILYEGRTDVREGDVLEFYTEVKKKRIL